MCANVRCDSMLELLPVTRIHKKETCCTHVSTDLAMPKFELNKSPILCWVNQVKAEHWLQTITRNELHERIMGATNKAPAHPEHPSVIIFNDAISAAKGSDCPHMLIYSLSFCKHTEQHPSVQPNRSHDTSPHGQVMFGKYSTNPFLEGVDQLISWQSIQATQTSLLHTRYPN